MRHLRDVLVSFGPVGLLILATLENAGPPTPGGTDFVLLFLAAARPDDAMLCAGLAILGSLIGAAIFFEVMHRGGEKLLAKYTTSGRGAGFREWSRRYGLITVFVSALVPLPILPYKAFVACAGAMGVSRTRFMAVLTPARVIRYFALAYLGQQLGEQGSEAWIKSHYGPMLGLVTIIGLASWAIIRRVERAEGYNEDGSRDTSR